MTSGGHPSTAAGTREPCQIVSILLLRMVAKLKDIPILRSRERNGRRRIDYPSFALEDLRRRDR